MRRRDAPDYQAEHPLPQVVVRVDEPDLSHIENLVHDILPGYGRLLIERVRHGGSTYVYRVRTDGQVFYLRVLPEPGASFAPEVLAHRLLRQHNVRVPDVITFEHRNQALQRSVMITTEVEGEPIDPGLPDEAKRRILREAGRDLAVINSTAVEGFGWIKRDKAEVSWLEAEHRTHRDFALEGFEEHVDVLVRNFLSEREVRQVREVFQHFDPWLNEDQGRLAHGDFDVTHIFQRGGQYTGIIDFGEIRGGDRCYDLGHFRVHDAETIPQRLLPYLVEGYTDVEALPPDYERRIALSSLLIGIAALARRLDRLPGYYRGHLVRAIRSDLGLLSGAG